MLPTAKQGIECIKVCQMLSNLYQDIHLFRFDEKTGEIYILAGETIEIIINREGIWEFINEAGF
ncbi:DUF6888 family protein [Tolypothrix sp. NIES-4075]|uniref:DUF6888 family protein n=1 Tax=Tolypothrix sp. NIES-4075 TaxID=2005459 RepID=UPI000B5C6B94